MGEELYTKHRISEVKTMSHYCDAGLLSGGKEKETQSIIWYSQLLIMWGNKS
jgi:hypothetical protein